MEKQRKIPKKAKILLCVAAVLAVLCVAFKILNTGDDSLYSAATNTQVTRSVDRGGKITTAVQQIMIGSECGSYEKAEKTLKAIKDAGYDAIELNDFMIHKTGITVKLLTKFAGMPIGNGGGLDWPTLIENSGLKVVSLHSYLNTIEEDPQAIAEEAKCFGTDTVVITAMYRYDYSSLSEVESLAARLNAAGKALAQYGIRLLYHNHNVEMQRVAENRTAFDVLIEETDPQYVNFEFDSYWATDSGANVHALMEKLGSRLKLWHITDRGCRQTGPYMTPILEESSVELGTGNMDLEGLAEIAVRNGVEGVVLETHKNWIDKDPIESLQISAEFMRKTFSE